MENMALVGEYLGGKKSVGEPQTELDFVEIIRNGLPMRSWTTLSSKLNLSDELIYRSLKFRKRTFARRKELKQPLKPHESELVLRLARAYATAVNVIGDTDRAREWLITPNRALAATPISLLDTGIGFQQVLDTLKRIEYGVYS